MDLERLKTIQDVVSGFAALAGGVLIGLWAYTKYVLERSLLPPVQFDVSCKAVGRQCDHTVLEITLCLKNVGTSALVATDVRVDVLYLNSTDQPSLFADPSRATFGRLRFPHSLRRELLLGTSDSSAALVREPNTSETARTGPTPRGILLLEHDTFVQPAVDQIYGLATTVPASVSVVLVWASFRYAQRPSAGQQVILRVARRLGLIQYSLTHVRKPHTVERVFFVGRDATVIQA
jgi:hypothetical protein